MKVIYYPDDIEGAEDIKGQVDFRGNVHDLAVGEHKQIDDEAAAKLQGTFKFLEVYTEKEWADRNEEETEAVGGLAALSSDAESEEEEQEAEKSVVKSKKPKKDKKSTRVSGVKEKLIEKLRE